MCLTLVSHLMLWVALLPMLLQCQSCAQRDVALRTLIRENVWKVLCFNMSPEIVFPHLTDRMVADSAIVGPILGGHNILVQVLG